MLPPPLSICTRQKVVQVWLKIPSPFCSVGACPRACQNDMLWNTCRASWAESITHNTGWVYTVQRFHPLQLWLLNLLVTPQKYSLHLMFPIFWHCSTAQLLISLCLWTECPVMVTLANSESLYVKPFHDPPNIIPTEMLTVMV